MSNTNTPKSTKSTQPVRKADNRDNTESVVNATASVDNSTLPLDVTMETDVILSTGTSTSVDTTVPSEATVSTDTTDATVSTTPPKQQRIGTKQRKLDYEEYKATFLTPKILTDRKQTSISKQLLARITWLVRHLGDNETTVSGFIDTVLQKHIDDYESDYEIWRKL